MSTARQRLAEADITWSEDGQPQGFLIGRAAALSDWQFRREEEAFQRLCATLRAARWQSQNRERYRTWTREYERRPEVRAKTIPWRKQHRRKQRAEELKTAPGWPCKGCGSPIRPKWGRGRKKLYCTRHCRANHYYHLAHPEAPRRGPRVKAAELKRGAT